MIAGAGQTRIVRCGDVDLPEPQSEGYGWRNVIIQVETNPLARRLHPSVSASVWHPVRMGCFGEIPRSSSVRLASHSGSLRCGRSSGQERYGRRRGLKTETAQEPKVGLERVERSRGVF